MQKLHSKRSNKWPIVRFINNGSEITTLMGYSFKTKSTNTKKSNIYKKEHTF